MTPGTQIEPHRRDVISRWVPVIEIGGSGGGGVPGP
jgi:hypothetical protein